MQLNLHKIECPNRKAKRRSHRYASFMSQFSLQKNTYLTTIVYTTFPDL